MMIFDTIQNAKEYYSAHPLFDKAFAFLCQSDLSLLNPGKYPIDGDRLFAKVFVYQTKTEHEAKFEGHRRYIDIQYVLEGQEVMSYCPLSQSIETEPYDEGNDIAYFNATNPSYLDVQPGQFAIFFPEDIHKAGFDTDPSHRVTKILIKVAVEEHH
jgi:YhcH/YjgK/YiaL family protein